MKVSSTRTAARRTNPTSVRQDAGQGSEVATSRELREEVVVAHDFVVVWAESQFGEHDRVSFDESPERWLVANVSAKWRSSSMTSQVLRYSSSSANSVGSPARCAMSVVSSGTWRLMPCEPAAS